MNKNNNQQLSNYRCLRFMHSITVLYNSAKNSQTYRVSTPLYRFLLCKQCK